MRRKPPGIGSFPHECMREVFFYCSNLLTMFVPVYVRVRTYVVILDDHNCIALLYESDPWLVINRSPFFSTALSCCVFLHADPFVTHMSCLSHRSLIDRDMSVSSSSIVVHVPCTLHGQAFSMHSSYKQRSKCTDFILACYPDLKKK